MVSVIVIRSLRRIERLIKLVQQSETALGGAAGCEGAEPGFRIKFRQTDGGQFFQQFVHAHALIGI